MRVDLWSEFYTEFIEWHLARSQRAETYLYIYSRSLLPFFPNSALSNRAAEFGLRKRPWVAVVSHTLNEITTSSLISIRIINSSSIVYTIVLHGTHGPSWPNWAPLPGLYHALALSPSLSHAHTFSLVLFFAHSHLLSSFYFTPFNTNSRITNFTSPIIYCFLVLIPVRTMKKKDDFSKERESTRRRAGPRVPFLPLFLFFLTSCGQRGRIQKMWTYDDAVTSDRRLQHDTR